MKEEKEEMHDWRVLVCEHSLFCGKNESFLWGILSRYLLQGRHVVSSFERKKTLNLTTSLTACSIFLIRHASQFGNINKQLSLARWVPYMFELSSSRLHCFESIYRVQQSMWEVLYNGKKNLIHFHWQPFSQLHPSKSYLSKHPSQNKMPRIQQHTNPDEDNSS